LIEVFGVKPFSEYLGESIYTNNDIETLK